MASWVTLEEEEEENKELHLAAVGKKKVSKKGALKKAEERGKRWNKVFSTLLKSGEKRLENEIRLLLMEERGDRGMERRKSFESFVKHSEEWGAERTILQKRIGGLKEALEFMIERHGMPNESVGKNLK